MALSMAGDWAVFDDLTSLTYYVKTGEGTYAAPVTIDNVLWRKLNQLDYQKRPYLLQKTARPVNLWSQNCSGIVPVMDDKIIDASNTTWFVESVDYLNQDDTGSPTRFRCICIKQT